MARFLAYTTPLRGHLYPLVPTLQELVHRGHYVAIRTRSDEVINLGRLGIRAAAVNPSIRNMDTIDWEGSRGAGRHQPRMVARWAGIEMKDFRLALEEEGPDVALIDGAAWGAGVAAEASGVRWAYAAPFCLPLRSRDAPPFGLGLAPSNGVLGRIRDGIVSRLVTGPVERAFRQVINEVRVVAGLRPLRWASDLFLIPPLLLSYTAEPFEFPRSDWPASVQMVGPGVWDPYVESPPWLRQIEGPVIVVTCSSDPQDDGPLIDAALQAFGGRDVSVVVTAAAQQLVQRTAWPNVRIERFLPHRRLLDRAACVVCHGGMGITQKALAYGVPVCAVPFGRDQFEVARRVEMAQAGTRLLGRRLRTDRLQAAVQGALTRADGARRIAEIFAATGGPSAAADAMERLLP